MEGEDLGGERKGLSDEKTGFGDERAGLGGEKILEEAFLLKRKVWVC